MVAKSFLTDSTQGLGSKGQTISFSESSHVAYQIKADDAGSNMVGSKGQTILNASKTQLLQYNLP